jgi:Putative adhesin
METFDTPEPITVSLEVAVGSITLTAAERTTTTVSVAPSDPADSADVGVAAHTRVEYASGHLLVRTPKHWRAFGSTRGSVDVTIELPADSTVSADTGVVTLRATGPLGDFSQRGGVGNLQLEHVRGLKVQRGVGDLSAAHVEGAADVKLGSGQCRIARIDGAAAVKSANGNIALDTVAGGVQVQSANGNIEIGRAGGSVDAKSAHGDLRIGIAADDAVTARTARGRIDLAVWDGRPVWLELQTRFGRVHNSLDDIAAPDPGTAAAQVRASTAFGDITVVRAGDTAAVSS